MNIFHLSAEMQAAALEWRRQGRRIALVPTMGALHAGHAELLRAGRARCDRLVLSIFVNPLQFGPNEDLAAYPRTLEADCAMAREAGADAVFAPSPAEMYPAGFETHVEVERIGVPMEGACRPGHFRGVATVVLKLFLIVQPDAALFGWKDAQQFLLLRRMARDLNVPVEMVGVETVREPDGLAMSSRNRYLSPEERKAAASLSRGLFALREAAARGETRAERLLALARAEIAREPLVALQYLEMVSIDTLEPLPALAPGATLVALAAKVGKARLIDNIRL